jgi:hypothetical protein
MLLCENKRKERVFLSLTASQLTSRHLTTNPATGDIKVYKDFKMLKVKVFNIFSGT